MQMTRENTKNAPAPWASCNTACNETRDSVPNAALWLLQPRTLGSYRGSHRGSHRGRVEQHRQESNT